MSTLAYASLTTSREAAPSGKSTTTSSPGVGTYIDAFAALVPAEVLTLHGIILSYTTEKNSAGAVAIKTGGSQTLNISFWGLIILSMMLYAGVRLINKKWDKMDPVRMIIPPLAFTGWTMLQKITAFDAVWPGLPDIPRTVIALFLGVVLGLVSVALAYQIDKK